MTLETLNSAFAAAAFLSAACAVDRMGRRSAHVMRIAIVLVLVGAVGEMVTPWLTRWSSWVDTLFFGGVAAALFADRRVPTRDLVTGGPLTEEARRRYARAVHLARALSAAISAATIITVLAAWAGVKVWF